jgi:hypothetical protein
MPRGSKPGEHRGGRKAGTPNKPKGEQLVVAPNVCPRTSLKRRRCRLPNSGPRTNASAVRFRLVRFDDSATQEFPHCGALRPNPRSLRP